MPGKDLSELRDTIPESGDTSWDGPLNEVLEGILDDIEPSVRASEINIDGNLEVNGHTLTEVGALQLENLDDVLDAPADTCKVSVVDGELHYTDDDANVVRVTLNGTLDISSAGGFTGDYGDNGSNANYSDIAKLYIFEQGSGLTAHIRADQVQLQNGAAATRVSLEAPASLALSYTWTLPTAVPASTSLVQVSSAGQLSNTRAPVLDSATIPTLTGATNVTGALTAATTLGVTGATTLNTLAVTGDTTVEDIEVDGTATLNEWAFPTRSLSINVLHGVSIGSGTFSIDGEWFASDPADFLLIPINLHEGDIIESIDFRYRTANTSTKTVRLMARNGTSIASETFTTNTALAWTNRSFEFTDVEVSPWTSGANQGLYFRFSAATAGDGMTFISVNYRRDA